MQIDQNVEFPNHLKWYKLTSNAMMITAGVYFWYHLGDKGGIQRIDVMTAAVVCLTGFFVRVWTKLLFYEHYTLYLLSRSEETEKETE